MTEVCFVLRGRPGLGHVVPGLALARALDRRGIPISVITYGDAAAFAVEIVGRDKVFELRKDAVYSDYPGLELYDDGFRQIRPLLVSRNVRHVVLGGEYVLGYAGAHLSEHIAMIVNPEVFVDVPRNQALANFFAGAFADIDLLIPLLPLPTAPLMALLKPLQIRFTPCGPFRLQDGRDAHIEATPSDLARRCVVIANGGGLAFPTDTSSYTATAQGGQLWVDHTMAMTIAAVRSLRRNLGEADTVLIFSALTDAFAHRLDEAIAGDLRFTRSPPSARYYDAIGKADLFIARSGAGAVSDARDLSAACIFWPLPGHEEQAMNAIAATQAANRWQVTNPMEMEGAVRAALDSAPMSAIPSRLRDRSEPVADLLMRQWSLRPCAQ